MRLFAIGDIHGEANKLTKLLAILKEHHDLDLTKDKLIFLGDYIDRGKDSYRVLSLLYTLQKEYPNNVICLAGNHEWLMIDYHICKSDKGLWHMSGGKATERSFYKNYASKKCRGYLLNWLSNLPLFHEEPGFFFSHAPVFKDEHREQLSVDIEKLGYTHRVNDNFSKEELTWGYHKDYLQRSRVFDNGVVGVCGHIHDLHNNNPHPRFTDNYIYTDAGCGCHRDAPLCAVDVRTRGVIYAV